MTVSVPGQERTSEDHQESTVNRIDIDAQWLSNLVLERKVLFMALLSHQITIAGRASYIAETDDLSNPRLLRQINETQHRVAGGLCHLLQGRCFDDFEVSVASWLLAGTDAELNALLKYCWEQAKMHLEADSSCEDST